MMNIRYEYHLVHKHNAKTHTPAHAHDYYEIVYYYEGEGTTETENATYNYTKNSILFYPPHIVHDETHFSDTDVFCLGFTDPEKVVKLNTTHIFNDNGTLRNLFDQIKEELFKKQPYYVDMVESYTVQILSNLSRLTTDNYEYDKKNIILQLMSFIEKNLQYNLNIETLANSVGYSYDYFRHLFKQYTGQSPKQYLTWAQTERAKTLLTTTKLSMQEISEQCGFATYSHFSLFFKKQTGISPLQFKKTAATRPLK